jgi:GNAT superfamily N-acetyltransferase
MVHTEPLSAREQLPHLAQIGVVAFSGLAYDRFTRPNHTQFPDRGFYHGLHKFRTTAVSQDKVIRVALADDADPWVDVGLKGPKADSSRWMRGKWVNGEWHSAELVDGELKDKVCEGRILGYSVWERHWPEDATDARLAKERCGSGTVWPVDSVWKSTSLRLQAGRILTNVASEIERAALSLASAYFKRVNPDPAESPENLALVESEGIPQLLALTKPALDRCKRVGHISISSIAVDPIFHRRGIGARLMRWGIERAEIEGCPIILVASSQGYSMYEKMGFETYGVLTIRELTGDKVMAYWPKTFDERADVQEQVVEVVEKPEVKAEIDATSGTLAEAGCF